MLDQYGGWNLKIEAVERPRVVSHAEDIHMFAMSLIPINAGSNFQLMHGGLFQQDDDIHLSHNEGVLEVVPGIVQFWA